MTGNHPTTFGSMFLALLLLSSNCYTEANMKRDTRATDLNSMITRSESGEECVGALYFMTNEDTGNSVIINCIQSDGRLRFSTTTPTFDVGITTPTTPPDALFFADSIIVSGNHLFLVNAGSDTVSMFEINPNSLMELTYVDSVPSGGNTPVSLAYSDELKILCVLNGGAKNGVACFKVKESSLRILPQTVQPFNQTLSTPPTNILGTVSDILFTEDSEYLIVSIKGSEDGPLFHGIITIEVDQNGVLSQPKENDLGEYPYSMSLISKSHPWFVFTDPGHGVSISKVIIENGTVETFPKVIPNQMETCWSAFSTGTGNLFTIDFSGIVSEGIVTVTENQPPTYTLLNQYNLQGPTLDVRVATVPSFGKEYLYVLKVTNGSIGVHVLDIGNSGMAISIQTYVPKQEDLGVLTLTQGTQGMGVYMRAST